MSKSSVALIPVAGLAALMLVGSAVAQTTRAAVVADLVAARKSGELADLQAEKGVAPATPANAKAPPGAMTALPLRAVLLVTPTEVQERTTAALTTDHGENAARELGNFPAAILRRATAVATK